MSGFIYGLCALTALLCAFLLWRTYLRNRYKVLFWSGICFTGLALSNILLVVDKIMLPLMDLSACRHVVTLVSMLALIYGLIWSSE